MKRLFVIFLLGLLPSLKASAQSPELLSAYKNVVNTINEYDVTSVDIKEIDGLSIGSGLLRFNSQRLIYDGSNLVFSYKQTPADRYACANSKYWKPGSFSISMPIDGSYMEVSKAFYSAYNYYVVKIKNNNGITMTSNGTKELIQEYSFATSQELTANKFYQDLDKLLKIIKEEQFGGKLGNALTNHAKSQQRSQVKSGSKNKGTTRPKDSKKQNQQQAVKNAGNRSTKTIIK